MSEQTHSPADVTLIEVGPRDGFQNIKTFIPTGLKVEIVEALARAGVAEMEITSFVNPKAIPQMADAAEVSCRVLPNLGNTLPLALVPNLRGAQNALSSGIRKISCVISVSEAHNRENVGQTTEASIEGLRTILKYSPELVVRLNIATAFGCPFKGVITEDEVLRMAETGLEAGVSELVLCDTIGVANPRQVESLSRKVLALAGSIPVALHLHDTRGLGIANTYAGYQSGVRRFEATAGGLGGCPFAPGAAGNTAMEDTIYLFSSMGVRTHISLDLYLEAVELIKRYIKPDLTGRMSYACSYPGFPDR